MGLRLAADIGQKESTRFGFDVSNGDFQKAFSEINAISNVKVNGIHIHLPFRMPNTFRDRMDFLKNVPHLYPSYRLDYISLGGGYMGRIPDEMRDEFSFSPPSYREYAKIVAGSFSTMMTSRAMSQYTELIIEPGSALVADAMKLVTKVINTKESRGRRIATLSGSTYQMNPTVKDIRRSIKVFTSADRKPKEETDYNGSIDMAGYTCIEGDYLYRGYNGSLSEGDFVVFDNVGSYSIVMKPPFILPDVPVISLTDTQAELLVKRQTSEDVFERLFRF